MSQTSSTTTLTRTQEIIERHDQFMSINYGRVPVAMVRGEGSHLWDAEGKPYLDLFSGFGAGLLGHCHPDLVDAVTTQAKLLWHPGNTFHTEPQTLVAKAIAEHGFGGRSFFSHSGADANEAALKLARLYGRARPGKVAKRYKVITTFHSFHGRTFGTMVATGQEKVRMGYEPFLPGFTHVPYNDLKAMRQAVDDETVAIMVEPIQGEGGANVPDQDYLPGLRQLCNDRDLLLICDEVWTGGGRTGRWFAHQHWNIEPDIMTLAKGVGGGLPVGIMCAQPRVAELFDHRKHGVVAHATTLGGNCLSMAVAARIFDVVQRDNLVTKAASLGQHAVTRLQRFAKGTSVIKQVRGKGLFLGIELSPQAGAWFKSASDVVAKLRERGVLINATQDVVLRIAPALTISQAELDAGLDAIEQVIHG